MTQTDPREEEVRAANEIFTLLSEGHGLAVTLDALAGRDGVGEETRSELSNRIRKLRVKGFRNANRAPHDRLVETIVEAIAEGDHRLAAAILGAWMETHSTLRERAAAHLRERSIEVVDAPPVRFTSCWDTDEWLLERNRMLRDSDGARAHRDDAALMLSLVSGRFPRPPAGRIRAFQDLDRHAVGPARVSARMARRRGQPGQVGPLHPAGEGTRGRRRRRRQDRRPVERDRGNTDHQSPPDGVTVDRPAQGQESTCVWSPERVRHHAQLRVRQPIRHEREGDDRGRGHRATRSLTAHALIMTCNAAAATRGCTSEQNGQGRTSEPHRIGVECRAQRPVRPGGRARGRPGPIRRRLPHGARRVSSSRRRRAC